MSNSLQPHGLQHVSLPYLSPTPGACWNSCSLSQWYHPRVSSSVISFSSCLQFSQHQDLFQWVSSLHQVAKALMLQHQSFQWIFRLISFRIDWFDLLAVQETLKTLLQHHSSKASILWCSAFFIVQFSHPYMIIEKKKTKPIALTIWTFVTKVMSLLFNMLSRFIVPFLPRSKHLLISWLVVTVHTDFGAQEDKICHRFQISPSICHEVSDETGCYGLHFLNVEF